MAMKMLIAALTLSTVSAMELTKASFQTEVKDSGKNAFVSWRPLHPPRRWPPLSPPRARNSCCSWLTRFGVSLFDAGVD